MHCEMDHIVLNTEDEERMIRFYSEVLQLPPERLDEYHAGNAPFPSVRLNEHTIIDLFPKKIWESQSMKGVGRKDLNHFCICLEQVEWKKLIDFVTKSGTTIDLGPVPRWGAYGVGISVYFKDPEGNTIEARYYEAKL
jgi:catechol 2,3-dioxygenase-like lactoylglutathione lyase family enzyme